MLWSRDTCRHRRRDWADECIKHGLHIQGITPGRHVTGARILVLNPVLILARIILHTAHYTTFAIPRQPQFSQSSSISVIVGVRRRKAKRAFAVVRWP